MSTPPVQGRITTGERCCGRIIAEPEVLCGIKAIGHFLWTEDGDNGVACIAHTAWAMAHAVDYHPITDDCTMPGTEWVYSSGGVAGCCRWPLEASDATETDHTTELADVG